MNTVREDLSRKWATAKPWTITAHSTARRTHRNDKRMEAGRRRLHRYRLPGTCKLPALTPRSRLRALTRPYICPYMPLHARATYVRSRRFPICPYMPPATLPPLSRRARPIRPRPPNPLASAAAPLRVRRFALPTVSSRGPAPSAAAPLAQATPPAQPPRAFYLRPRARRRAARASSDARARCRPAPC